MDEPWDQRRETFAEHIQRIRCAEQMASYDDQIERRVEENRAHGFYWHKRPSPEDERQTRATTRRKASVRLPKRATRRVTP